MPARKNGTSSSATPLVRSVTRRSTVFGKRHAGQEGADDGGHARIDGEQREREEQRHGDRELALRQAAESACTRGITRRTVRVPNCATKKVKPMARAAVSATSR